MKFLISYPKQTEKNSVFKTFFTDSALERLGKLGEIVYNEGEANYTPDEMKEALKGIDVVFTALDKANRGRGIFYRLAHTVRKQIRRTHLKGELLIHRPASLVVKTLRLDKHIALRRAGCKYQDCKCKNLNSFHNCRVLDNTKVKFKI